MAPTRPSSYSSALLGIISSTSYPPIPSLDSLESLLSDLHAQQLLLSAAPVVAQDAAERERVDKKLRKEGKRKRETEEGERAALEANERSMIKLEGYERNKALQAGAMNARTGSPAGVKVKREHTLSPAPSNASSASFRPNPGHAQPVTYSLHQKKKKIRVVDSDEEGHIRDRSMTLASPPPPAVHTSSTSGLKLKLAPSHTKARPHLQPDPSPTPSASTPTASALLGAGIDFSLPHALARPLVPPRPGVQKPLKPGPKQQADVEEDFSSVKVPSQIAFTTFWSSVEPYLREIREDDLALLNFKADAPESYEIPSRGRHYTEVWDEEDGNPPGTTPHFPIPSARHTVTYGALPFPHFVPSVELREENLYDEHRGLGTFTERIVAGMMPYDPDQEQSEHEGLAADDYDGNRDMLHVDVVDLEDRMKKELRGAMLLGEHEDFDPNNRDDDEISSALRQCQRVLLQQTRTNDSRKARLANVARTRLAYHEYHNSLEGIEKSIEADWVKRIKKYGAKKAGQPVQSGVTGARPPVTEHLKQLVRTRKQWVESIGALMRERPRGEVVGLPVHSIYAGLGDEIDHLDEKTVEDAVEVESLDVDEVEGVA